MSARDELVGMNDLLIHELALDVLLIRLSSRGRKAVERHVPDLGANDQLVPRRAPAGQQLSDRRSATPLRSLAPIVDRGVDHVDSARRCVVNRGRVRGVHVVGCVAEVGSDTDRRNAQAKRLAEVVALKLARESRLVACRSGARRL